MALATFAAGCFWGVESKFRQLPGVLDTRVGYCGGTVENPSYQDVCRGDTGHAESIRIEFDPTKISYAELVTFFWGMHNPTTPNQQGPDRGYQYRSILFYQDQEQREIALQVKQNLEQQNVFSSPIITEIVPLTSFYEAEEYHQRYHEKHRSSNTQK